MKFQTSYRITVGLLFLLQFSDAGDSKPEDIALTMQRNVEHLIEKILTHVEEYYQKIKGELKCIPDYIPDNLIETLKKSIDCVHVNEKNYVSGKINNKVHLKNFLKCFSDAKKEVQETMKAIDPTRDHCPQNMTEKTYQINVTTTFTKTFHINIKNGLEVTHREINFGKHLIDQNMEVSDTNSTEPESTDAYNDDDLKANFSNSSSEITEKSNESTENFEDSTHEFNLEERNSTEDNFTTGKKHTSDNIKDDGKNSTNDKTLLRSQGASDEEQESKENGYYETENDKEAESSSHEEYVYEDETHIDGNKSEAKKYLDKVKPQKKNSESFEISEKEMTSERLQNRSCVQEN